jgi:hypothetical protein
LYSWKTEVKNQKYPICLAHDLFNLKASPTIPLRYLCRRLWLSFNANHRIAAKATEEQIKIEENTHSLGELVA